MHGTIQKNILGEVGLFFLYIVLHIKLKGILSLSPNVLKIIQDHVLKKLLIFGNKRKLKCMETFLKNILGGVELFFFKLCHP